MSYSFAVKGLTRQSVLEQADAEFQKVRDQQPIHDADVPIHATALGVQMELLPEEAPAGTQFIVSVSGSCWKQADEDLMRGCSVSINASLQSIPPAT